MTSSGFTPEEEKNLTALDALAHDLLRVESQQREKIAPCWLVCSDKTRAEYRQKVVDMVNTTLGRLPLWTVESAPKHLERMISGDIVARWRAAELAMKQEREAGHPRAFFT